MIALGSLEISRHTELTDTRNKVFLVVKILTGDDIFATRVATSVSMVYRTLETDGDAPRLLMQLGEEQGVKVILLRFLGQTQMHLPEAIQTACRSKVLSVRPDGTHELLLVARWRGLKDPGREVLEQIAGILRQKNRDELMFEVQKKNRELEESLDQLRRTTSAKERMESELNIAADIQMSMLPLEFPAFPDRAEFDIHAILHPAREVGGDLYDFFFLDEDHLCVGVGDVSGKGVPAALFMAVSKTLIKSRAANDRSPASILTHVSNELAQNNESSMFVTMILAILNVKTGDLVFSNAGHNPPYILRQNGELERLSALHGVVLGAIEGMVYREDVSRLLPGDRILFYTDGLTEAMNTKRELYSEQRLVAILRDATDKSAKELVQEIVESAHAFETGMQQADDITVLSLDFYGHAGEIPRMEITLKNLLSEIDRCNREFSVFADRAGIPSLVKQQISLVLDELLNNTINYGYEEAEGGIHEISVQFELTGKRLAITITDQGIPFNPFSMQEPDTQQALEERKIGGLGIHLVKNLVDEFTYHRRIGANIVSLTKILPDEST